MDAGLTLGSSGCHLTGDLRWINKTVASRRPNGPVLARNEGLRRIAATIARARYVVLFDDRQ